MSVAKVAAKTSWKCRDDEACLRWLEENAAGEFADLETLHALLFQMQHMWTDTRTCRDRRNEKLPVLLRELYAKLAAAPDELSRRELQRTAWHLRKKLCAEARSSLLSERVRRGQVLQRSKKLHAVKQIVLVLTQVSGELAGQASSSQDDYEQFAGKWGVGNPEERIGVLIFLLANEADGVPVLPSALTEVFSSIKRKSSLTIMVFLFLLSCSLPRSGLMLLQISCTQLWEVLQLCQTSGSEARCLVRSHR
jgi:hypothetical protein